MCITLAGLFLLKNEKSKLLYFPLSSSRRLFAVEAPLFEKRGRTVQCKAKTLFFDKKNLFFFATVNFFKYRKMRPIYCLKYDCCKTKEKVGQKAL
jgi:hypothetical protein